MPGGCTRGSCLTQQALLPFINAVIITSGLVSKFVKRCIHYRYVCNCSCVGEEMLGHRLFFPASGCPSIVSDPSSTLEKHDVGGGGMGD